jgi:hypothetical protein
MARQASIQEIRGNLMENVWVLAAVWVGLALIATLIAIWFKVSTALSEIVVGTVAQLVIGAFIRAESRNHYAGAILAPCCHRDWRCYCANDDRKPPCSYASVPVGPQKRRTCPTAEGQERKRRLSKEDE